MPDSQPWHDSVRLVDMHYMTPGRAASYVILENGRAAIVDNTRQAIPHLEAELAAHDIGFGQVDYLIITHVHLDHAGGTGHLARLCPDATVLAHPKAARHIIDPSRIVAGSRGVYGDEMFEELYGEVLPVEAGRVRAMQDGETLEWGERTLRFEFALGHATHHFVIYDDKSDGVFTGDVLGMGQSSLLHGGPSWCHCVTAPPDFDAAEARKSALRLAESGAQFAYISHFGVFNEIPARVQELIKSIGRMQAIVEEAAASTLDDGELMAWCVEQVGAAMDAHLREAGVSDFEANRRLMDGDQFMNGMGLAHAARRLRQTARA